MAARDWEATTLTAFDQRCLNRENLVKPFEQRVKELVGRMDFRGSYLANMDGEMEKLRNVRRSVGPCCRSEKIGDDYSNYGGTAKLEEELIKLKDCKNRVVEQRDFFITEAENAKPDICRFRPKIEFSNIVYLNKVAERGKLTQLRCEIEALEQECHELKLAFQAQTEDHLFRYLMLKDGLNLIHKGPLEDL